MIAEIEDAIIAHLRAACSTAALGYTVREVASYGGEFDEGLENEIRRFPAIWVAFAGAGKPIAYGTSRKKWIKPLNWVTMVGTRSVRGERQTRMGMPSIPEEPGAYQMLDDVEAALVNQDFGLAIYPLFPGAVKTLFSTKLNNSAVAVFSQEWHTRVVIDVTRSPTEDADWLRLGVKYHLTPDDGTADAEDLITLAP